MHCCIPSRNAESLHARVSRDSTILYNLPLDVMRSRGASRDLRSFCAALYAEVLVACCLPNRDGLECDVESDICYVLENGIFSI